MNKSLASIVISICFVVSGCGMAAVVAMTAASGGLFAWQVSDAMQGVDYSTTIQAGFKQVWKQALITAEDMNIQILDKKLDDKKTGGVITGKTDTHEKIEIVVETVTSNTTNVGIKARKREVMGLPLTSRDVDIPFASTILNNMRAKLNTGCGTGGAIGIKEIPSSPSTEKLSGIYLITIKNSNIRATSTTKSQILTTIKKGTKVEKIGESRDWFKVRLPSGETGHIFKPLVVIIP